MKIVGIVTFKNKMYWLDNEGSGLPGVDILDNGKWRDALTIEVDLFDLLERGHKREGTKEDYTENPFEN